MYQRRDFDLVTVSVKYPNKTGVMKLLKCKHASMRSLQLATEDSYGLPAAFEPTWNARAPFRAYWR